MKKRDIWISVAIIAAAVLLLYLYSQGKGRIKIDAGGAAATLQLRSSWLGKATISSRAEPTKVSSRVHRPAQLSLSMKQGSNTWRLDSRGPWGDLSYFKRPQVNIHLHVVFALEIPWYPPRVPAGAASAIFEYAGVKNFAGLIDNLKAWWRLPSFVFFDAADVFFSGLPLHYEPDENLTAPGLHIGFDHKRRSWFCPITF